MLRIVLVLISVVTVMGEGCCPPDAWEGLEGLLAGSVQNGRTHLTKGGLMLHLNNTGKIIAIEEDLFVDDHEIKLKVIQDYNRGTEYMILDGKCTKKTLEPWKPKCIPDDAQVVQNTYFGAGSATVAVKTYSFIDKGLQVYATATVNGCIPIVEAISGTTAQGVSTVDVVEFSGITPGIKDPSVFNIPSICNSVHYIWRLVYLVVEVPGDTLGRTIFTRKIPGKLSHTTTSDDPKFEYTMTDMIWHSISACSVAKSLETIRFPLAMPQD